MPRQGLRAAIVGAFAEITFKVSHMGRYWPGSGWVIALLQDGCVAVCNVDFEELGQPVPVTVEVPLPVAAPHVQIENVLGPDEGWPDEYDERLAETAVRCAEAWLQSELTADERVQRWLAKHAKAVTKMKVSEYYGRRRKGRSIVGRLFRLVPDLHDTEEVAG